MTYTKVTEVVGRMHVDSAGWWIEDEGGPATTLSTASPTEACALPTQRGRFHIVVEFTPDEVEK